MEMPSLGLRATNSRGVQAVGSRPAASTTRRNAPHVGASSGVPTEDVKTVPASCHPGPALAHASSWNCRRRWSVRRQGWGGSCVHRSWMCRRVSVSNCSRSSGVSCSYHRWYSPIARLN